MAKKKEVYDKDSMPPRKYLCPSWDFPAKSCFWNLSEPFLNVLLVVTHQAQISCTLIVEMPITSLLHLKPKKVCTKSHVANICNVVYEFLALYLQMAAFCIKHQDQTISLQFTMSLSCFQLHFQMSKEVTLRLTFNCKVTSIT